jgi:hypothetical protein
MISWWRCGRCPGQGERGHAQLGRHRCDGRRGDGYRDSIAWLENGTIFTFAGSGLPTIGSVGGIGTPAWARTGDQNHDGRDDLYWYEDTNIYVLASNGTTFHSIGVVRGPGIGAPSWAVTGDFTGDGYRDSIAWLQGGTLFTFGGSGLATVGGVGGISTPTFGGVGDWNHDGKEDLYWYGSDTNIYVLESNGTTFHSIGSVRGPGIGTPSWAATGNFT